MSSFIYILFGLLDITDKYTRASPRGASCTDLFQDCRLHFGKPWEVLPRGDLNWFRLRTTSLLLPFRHPAPDLILQDLQRY